MGTTKPGVRSCGGPAVASAAPSADDEAVVIASQVTVERSLPACPAGNAAADTSPSLRALGHYRILEKLGEGALTTVYKACEPGNNRLIAIKLLRAERCRDEECRARLLREGALVLSLSHPNIVTVLGSGEIEGHPYIAMEWLDGRPLNEILADGGRRPLHDVLDIGIQIARALDYVHGKGIVHRDVKPGNMIRLAGSGTIKLTDFGIAHLLSAATAAPARSEALVGTPYYMSPEQVLGGNIDARSDLWALGVILYQMACRTRPFDADTIVALRYRIANDDPGPEIALHRNVPSGLRRIIERCLNKHPDERFQSARELAGALAGVLR